MGDTRSGEAHTHARRTAAAAGVGPAAGPSRLLPRGPILLGATLLATLALLPIGAEARVATTATINVTFFADGGIAMTLPDGTPVGATSGAATVIPGGYYTVVMTGPGGCTVLPHFDLKGPGESIFDNMVEGEVPNETISAFFQPNATYTWRSDALPNVIHTFRTSSEIVGSPPVQPKSGYSSGKGGTAKSWDLVGSGNAKLRGTIVGAVSADGRLSFSVRGKSVTSLAAGRWKFTITDHSASSGFVVQAAKRGPVTVTSSRFVGKRSAGVVLTAGRWIFETAPGRTAFSIRVTAPGA